MKLMRVLVSLVCLGLVGAGAILTQKSMQQDPKLNNLVHAEGYQTSPPGAFGHVEKRGSGPIPVVLMPGGSFGWKEFNDFMDQNSRRYTMVAVSLAGMGRTPAPPMPPPGTSYGEQTWMQGAVDALVRLIDQEQLDRPLLVGHMMEGSHIAFRMMMQRADRIRGVVLLAGSAKMVTPGQVISLEQRVNYMDTQMSQKWFKTVTLKTWNDNNFSPDTYSIDLERGRRLFDEVDDGPLPIYIRYLLEFHSGDLTLQFDRVKVPLLLLLPGFQKQVLDNPDRAYLKYYFLDSWEGAERNPLIEKKIIEDAHLLPWLDQPAAVSEAIAEFVGKLH